MLTRVQITNFKSIGQGPAGAPGVDIELKPLTFLVGPNGGGKSSILEAMAFASQQGRLTNRLLDTSDHRLLSQRLRESQRSLGFRRFFHKLEESRSVSVTVYPEVAERSQWESCTFRAMLNPPSEIDNQLIDRHTEDGFAIGYILDGKSTSDSRGELGRFIRKLVEQVYLIAGSRGVVRNEQKAIASDPEWVGRSSEDLVGLLAVISRPEHTAARGVISQTMVRLGMRDPWAGWKGEGLLGGTYVDPSLGVVLDAGNASQGGKQALAVVTQVCWSNPGSLTMIEEPEISLHPEAQVEMCRFLAENAAKGKQIIATTHSQFMLLALRKPIAEGTITADKIAVYHVERNKDRKAGEVGATRAEPLPLTKEGYLKTWVPSFSKVERELAREWVEALQRAEKGE